jgi:hypothetical protein
MRYIKVALLTIVFCLGSIVLALIGAFIWAEVTKEKPKTVRSYIEDTTPLDVSIYIENSDKVVRLSMPKNMRAGFVYPNMKGYTKNTADCMKAGKNCDGFVNFMYDGSSQPYSYFLNAKLDQPKRNDYAEYDGLKYQGRRDSKDYYHGDMNSKSCFGDEEPRTVVYVCSTFSPQVRICRVVSSSTADGFHFQYFVNEKFLTEWQTLHNKTCGLLRSFVVK